MQKALHPMVLRLFLWYLLVRIFGLRIGKALDMARAKWYELDNAAKIVPSTAKGADTRVFRITCELKEDVDGAILQQALDRTVPDFPHFASVLRKGLFWYYLDSSSIRAVVQPENKPPCSAIYFDGRRRLLYRVNYYRRRINLEMFHVLTDGTGAFAFLRAIVCNYLMLAHGLEEEESQDLSSVKEKADDAFNRYYQKETKGRPMEKLPRRAYHLQGERDEYLQMHLIEGTVSVSKFLKVVKEHQTTASAFTTALFMESILEEMRERDKKLPIVLSVPVNLRNYFKSETARNFFGVINVAFYPDQYDGTLGSILEVVQASFKRQLTQEQVALSMHDYARLEHNIAIRPVPLFIKNLVIAAVNSGVQKGITGTISNVGKITMPEPFASYIDRFSCFMAAPDVQISVCSFGGKMCFGVGSSYVTNLVMMRFFRKMVALGIDVEIATNDTWDSEDTDSAAQKRENKENNISAAPKVREEKNAVLSELQGTDPGQESPLPPLPERAD